MRASTKIRLQLKLFIVILVLLIFFLINYDRNDYINKEIIYISDGVKVTPYARCSEEEAIKNIGSFISDAQNHKIIKFYCRVDKGNKDENETLQKYGY